MVILLKHNLMKILMWLRKIKRQTQASEQYRDSLGEVVSDKSSPQQTGVKELSLISRFPVLWQGDRSGLKNNSVLDFEKLFCRNRYRACCQSKGNLSLNSAFSWPVEDSQLHTSVGDV